MRFGRRLRACVGHDSATEQQQPGARGSSLTVPTLGASGQGPRCGCGRAMPFSAGSSWRGGRCAAGVTSQVHPFASPAPGPEVCAASWHGCQLLPRTPGVTSLLVRVPAWARWSPLRLHLPFLTTCSALLRRSVRQGARQLPQDPSQQPPRLQAQLHNGVTPGGLRPSRHGTRRADPGDRPSPETNPHGLHFPPGDGSGCPKPFQSDLKDSSWGGGGAGGSPLSPWELSRADVCGRGPPSCDPRRDVCLLRGGEVKRGGAGRLTWKQAFSCRAIGGSRSLPQQDALGSAPLSPLSGNAPPPVGVTDRRVEQGASGGLGESLRPDPRPRAKAASSPSALRVVWPQTPYGRSLRMTTACPLPPYRRASPWRPPAASLFRCALRAPGGRVSAGCGPARGPIGRGWRPRVMGGGAHWRRAPRLQGPGAPPCPRAARPARAGTYRERPGGRRVMGSGARSAARAVGTRPSSPCAAARPAARSLRPSWFRGLQRLQPALPGV